MWTTRLVRGALPVALALGSAGCLEARVGTLTGGVGDADASVGVQDGGDTTVSAPRCLVPFELVGHTPAMNALGVDEDPAITIDFSCAVDVDSVAAALVVRGSYHARLPGSLRVVANGRVRFLPQGPLLPGEVVTVTLSDRLRDVDGRPLAAAATWRFTVGAGAPSQAGRYARSEPFPGDRNRQREVALRDVDRDGDLDVIFYGAAGSPGGLEVWSNDGAAHFALARSQQIGAFLGFTVGDVGAVPDPDMRGGEIDAVLVGGTGGLLVPGVGAAAQSESVPLDLTGVGVALDDLDADGVLDLLVMGGRAVPGGARDGHSYTARVRAASAPPPHQVLALGGDVDRALTGDLDRDRILDVLLLRRDAGSEVLLGAGRAFSTPAQPPATAPAGLVLAPWQVAAAALGDLDGDGDLDLLVGELRDPAARPPVWLGDGRGAFLASSAGIVAPRPDHRGEGSDIALGDLDGDGDLDGVVAHWAFGESRPHAILVNDGAAHFTLLEGNLGGGVAERVALGDLNGDGVLDIVMTSGPAVLWLSE